MTMGHTFCFVVRYQFLPQMIFLNSLFGYLSMLIVIKWCTGSQADLYHVMIYMFLSLRILVTISCFRARKYFRHDPFSFLRSLFELKLFAFHCCLFPNDSCRSFADNIVAFGDYCSSMDAFSKTIHFEEASL